MSSTSSALLLSILIKKATIQTSDNECYSYVVLHIGNVKSTTSVIKGQQPSWEEEFYFDLSDSSAGVRIELWQREPCWDKLLGSCQIHVDRNDDQYRKLDNSNERWLDLQSELISNSQGQIIRTCNPNGHSLFIRTYFELPSSLTEEESEELTAKLEILDQETRLHDQQLTNHFYSHFSNDSDYTSDVSSSINPKDNFQYSHPSMSQANHVTTTNENRFSPVSTKKPLAFVQPRIRDLNSTPNTTERLNENLVDKNMSLTPDEPFSYGSQSRRLPMNTTTTFDQETK